LKPFRAVSGSLVIDIYGGYGEIGGNCVLIRDRDRRIVIDNGIRFNILKKYYRGRVQPLGVNELRSIGAIPPLSVFEDVDAIYISHFHLDHLGLLGSLPHGVRVYVPSLGTLGVIEEWYKGSPTWLSELPHTLYVEVAELEPYKTDEHGVTPIPVSHSAYPSFSFIYEGYDRVVFYSGDLRVNNPLYHGVNTLRSIGEAVESRTIDIALLEGTNIGSVETPLGPDEFRSVFTKLLMGAGLVTVSIDPLDFELLTAISELASLNGRTVVVASERLVDIMPQWLNAFNVAGVNIAVATELEKPAPPRVDLISLREDVSRDPGGFIVIQEPQGFLEMLRKQRLWREELPRDSIVVLTTPEPLEAESELEEHVLATWLYSLGIQVYRLRISGHYYPYQFRDILDAIKPRELIPIHTTTPKAMLELFKKYSAPAPS